MPKPPTNKPTAQGVEVRMSGVSKPAWVEEWEWQEIIEDLGDPVFARMIVRRVAIFCVNPACEKVHEDQLLRSFEFDEDVGNKIRERLLPFARRLAPQEETPEGFLDLGFGEGDSSAPWAQDPDAWRS